jgi:proline iminopeptidase
MARSASGYVTTAAGVKLFWRASGEGSDHVVVLHGGPGLHMNYLRADLEPLANSRRVIFYDQRGGGQSTWPELVSELTADAHVSDLEALRIAFGFDRLTLLGHSWGGLLAGLYLAAYPDRVERLILVGADPPMRLPLWPLIDPAARLSVEQRARLEALHADLGRGAESESACRAYWSLLLPACFGDPARTTRMRGNLCDAPTGMWQRMALAAQARRSLGDWDLRAALAHVRVPTLIVHGAHDPTPVQGAVDWQTTLVGARLLLLPGVGHFPHVESPDEFFTTVDDFLQTCDERR